MTKLFNRNLGALRDRHPALAARMVAHKPAASLKPVPTQARQWDLSSEEGLFYGVPNPLQSAKARWQQTPLRNPALMVFLGIDLGYSLLAYLSAPNPNTRAYIIIEKDLDIFFHFLQIVDVRPLLEKENLHFAVGVPEAELARALKPILLHNLNFTLIRATHIEQHSKSYDRNKAYYRQALRQLSTTAAAIFDGVGNAPHDTFIGMRHMLLNLRTIAESPGIGTLFGKFRGTPGVVVATGPSLDKNYRLLREIQDRAVIISVDASLKFLLNKGIRPHFVTSLERVSGVDQFYDGIDPKICADTVQVALPIAIPEVFSAYPGPKAMLFPDVEFFEWLGAEKGRLALGHSAANMAFNLVVALGCDRVLLVGQDLAYGDNGESHAGAQIHGVHSLTEENGRPVAIDTPRNGKTSRLDYGIIRVPGNTSEWVYTNHMWGFFRNEYERDIAMYPGTVVNATEGGAFIAGTQVMSLRAAIDKHVGDDCSPASRIAQGLRVPPAGEAQAFLNRIEQIQVPETLRTLDAAMAIFQRARRSAEAALGKDGSANKVADTLNELYPLLRSPLTGDKLFHQTVFPLLMHTTIQVLLEYNDLPNRINHVEKIHSARLALIIRYLATCVSIIEKLKQLYHDPQQELDLPR